ncbi:hypothetical protein [Moraxella lacunata]|nr:hypothetical protein [Moraxella lacunata]
MAMDMEQKISDLLNIGKMSASFILQIGTVKQAQAWYAFLTEWIPYLAEEETGYVNFSLRDELDIVIFGLFDNLNKIGYILPKEIPTTLTVDEADDEESEEIFYNPFVEFLTEIITAFNDVHGFYCAYVAYLSDCFEFDYDMQDILCQFESELLSLAMAKLDICDEIAPNFKNFRYEIIELYKEWINIIKLKAFQANIPLKAELMDFISCTSGELSYKAEAESFGASEHNLHPDIYMNELLVGMRMIHQILPVIMEKLGIDDFYLDESNLRN